MQIAQYAPAKLADSAVALGECVPSAEFYNFPNIKEDTCTRENEKRLYIENKY